MAMIMIRLGHTSLMKRLNQEFRYCLGLELKRGLAAFGFQGFGFCVFFRHPPCRRPRVCGLRIVALWFWFRAREPSTSATHRCEATFISVAGGQHGISRMWPKASSSTHPICQRRSQEHHGPAKRGKEALARLPRGFGGTLGVADSQNLPAG